MGLIRCTCVYRLSTRAELDEGAAVVTVALRDPWCPAADLHARAEVAELGDDRTVR